MLMDAHKTSPPWHPYGMGATADNFTLNRIHGGVREV